MEIPPIRIPKRRVGVLIGQDGQVRQEIEERSGVRLDVDSESGEVWLRDEEAFDQVLVLKVQDVVKAIARGFAPDRAFRLWQDDAFLEIIDLTDAVGRNKKNLERVRSRLIGKDGRTREQLETMSGAQVSIFGKTVAIIGEIDELTLAREAVEMIIRGAPHATVYRFLENKRRELRLRDLGLA